MSDIPEFVNGLIIKAPREGAPDFVKCAISIRREELMTFLSSRTDEWINIDVKSSKKDESKWYGQVNTFKPESRQDASINNSQQNSPQAAPAPKIDDEFSDDIPF